MGYARIWWEMVGYGGMCWDVMGCGGTWWDVEGGLHVVRSPCTCFAKVCLLSPMVSTFA